MPLFVRFISRSFLVFACQLSLPGHAQQPDQPAGWFVAHPAWTTVAGVALSADGKKLDATPGGDGRILLINDAKPGTPHLRTEAFISDSIVNLEYMLAGSTKAGIYLHAGYRIQLDGENAGTLGVMVDGQRQPLPVVPPLHPVASKPGEWQRLEARVRAPRYNEASAKSQNALILEVKINGVVVQANTVPTGWCLGTEFEWESNGARTTIAVDAGSMAIREFALRRADFEAVAVPPASGQPTNLDQLTDYVKQGADLFRGLGCVECHAVQRGDPAQKTGPNLFGLFQTIPRDREIAAGEGHRFTIKADRSYLQRSLRTPMDELAIAESGPTTGAPFLPAMPPFLPTVLSDANIDALAAYLATLNEPPQQGPVVKLVHPSGLENYDPMADRLQLLVDRVVRIQRGPMERVSARSVHVGLPGGINYTFDPRLLAVVQVWQGGFLDLTGELLNRGGDGLKPGYESREIKLGPAGALLAPLNAAGQAVDLSFQSPVFKDGEAVRATLNSPRDLPDLSALADAQFLGYQRDSTNPASAPAFKYRVGPNIVALRTDIAADGRLNLLIDADFAAPQVFLINEAVLGPVTVSKGVVRNSRWTLPAGQYRAGARGRLTLAPKSWQAAPSNFNYLRQPLETRPAQPALPRGYAAASHPGPKDNYGRELLFEALGLALAPDSTVVVATRTAGIWRVVQGEWRLFAEGLFDGLGVVVEDQHGLVVVAGQKAELTRISDTNGDGLADKYETLADAFGYTGNYHAYMHGPVRTARGDYLFTLNLNDSSQGDIEYKAGGKYMGTGGGYRGWAIRVPAKGGFEPYADGLRSPASLGVAPDGRLWYADNQGEYFGTSKLFVLKKGAYYGHPAGLVDRPGMTPASPEIAWERVRDTAEQAVVLFPQGRLANSPGNPAWDTTGGRFGPFAGQMFIGDQTQSNLMRVGTEIVNGLEQGWAITFATNLESGVMRLLFQPDGSLLLGETGRGWQAKGGHVASLQHIRWDGKTVPPAIHSLSAVAGGFDLKFTVPVPTGVSELDLAAALAIKSWVYRDAPDYGSPELDEHAEPTTSVTLAPDRKSLRIALAKTAQPKIHPQQTARVYQLTLSGQKIWNDPGPGFEAFYTLYSFPTK
ncbi:MAG TPA: family 16 glycoside hydrolase [Lacunisphaera sp.]|nr:family 16 glycoside hydrolase [Lacunisphaera sp.]